MKLHTTPARVIEVEVNDFGEAEALREFVANHGKPKPLPHASDLCGVPTKFLMRRNLFDTYKKLTRYCPKFDRHALTEAVLGCPHSWGDLDQYDYLVMLGALRALLAQYE